MKTSIFIRLQVEGVHCWPDCGIEEVNYLRNPHRHHFGVKAYLRVDGDNREVEFIQLKHKVTAFLGEKYWSQGGHCLDFGGMSCEMIAKELVREFTFDRVIVDEDGENGAEVER